MKDREAELGKADTAPSEGMGCIVLAWVFGLLFTTVGALTIWGIAAGAITDIGAVFPVLGGLLFGLPLLIGAIAGTLSARYRRRRYRAYMRARLPVAGVFSNVEFTIDTTLPSEGLPSGPFTATGAAVDAGWICPKGDTQDFGVTRSPFAGGGRWVGDKTFTCDDGSGTFTLRFDAAVIFDPFSNLGPWRVTSGTGDYTKLTGEGTLTATQSDAGVLELWAGPIQNSG